VPVFALSESRVAGAGPNDESSFLERAKGRWMDHSGESTMKKTEATALIWRSGSAHREITVDATVTMKD